MCYKADKFASQPESDAIFEVYPSYVERFPKAAWYASMYFDDMDTLLVKEVGELTSCDYRDEGLITSCDRAKDLINEMKARLPSGMGGGPQNMNAMIRQAQKMQEDMANLQAELETREYTVTAGGGMVTVVINGKKEIVSIDIKPEVVDPDDIETLTDILTAAVNEAIRRVEDTNAAEMSQITGAAGMPGLF